LSTAGGGASESPAGRIERLGGDPPSPFEGQFGYCRVLRAGPFVIIGGTTSIDPDGVVLGTTPYEQAMEIFGKVEHELGRLGVSLTDVIQTRMYVTDISRGEEVGRAHGDVFGEIRPLATMVEVSALIDPRMLVEIEAVAFVG
jgi:enamine deaminase RidA (YjgF/YER057c/UK114 family)